MLVELSFEQLYQICCRFHARVEIHFKPLRIIIHRTGVRTYYFTVCRCLRFARPVAPTDRKSVV